MNNKELLEALKKAQLVESKDESLEESENLPEPDVIARKIAEDLQNALEQFQLIAEDLGEEKE